MKFCILLLFPVFSFSQSSIDNALEYWIQFQSENNQTEEFSLALESYMVDKLQINNSSKEELARFPLFRSNHVNSILQYLSLLFRINLWLLDITKVLIPRDLS